MSKKFPFQAELAFQACGRSWRLRRGNMEDLWEKMASVPPRSTWAQDERLPYWAELWPASLALAEWLADNREHLRNRACLDMGCGLGFTALAGQWLGGQVTGMDYEAEALHYARINAVINHVDGVNWTVMDWRERTLPHGTLSIVWGSDIVYEKCFATPVAAFLTHVLAPNGVAWLAEPGRTVFQYFLSELPRHGLSFRKVHATSVQAFTPQTTPVPVALWEITPADNSACTHNA